MASRRMGGGDDGGIEQEAVEWPELGEENGLATVQGTLEQLMAANEGLERENNLFRGYLESTAPEMLAQDGLDEDTDGIGPLGGPGSGSGGHGRRGRSRIGSGGGRGPAPRRLRPEQKYSIAVRQLEHLKGNIRSAQIAGERRLEEIKALMEESEIRAAELKKETYEFKRDVINALARAGGPQASVADKLARYTEDKIRAKDGLLTKLKAKNASLHHAIAKVENQLSQKEEMGDLLHAIDFDQMKIENQQYNEKIELRNKELLKLKFTAGSTVQILNSHKKKLSTLIAEAAWLRKETETRSATLKRILAETAKVVAERDKARRLNAKLRSQQEEYKVPAVLEYVEQKAREYELQKKVKDWERKVEIAEMALKRSRALASAAIAADPIAVHMAALQSGASARMRF